MTSTRKLITVDEVKGAWAIIPTPAKGDAGDWRAEDTVDLDEAARAVEGMVQAGVDGILSMGTLGEAATLTWEEKKAFMATIVEAAAGRIPVFVGTTTLNTRDTIRETRLAADLGATGTMLGVPMWCAPTVRSAVQFYRDVAEACPNMGICIYQNPEAFKFDFPTAFWAQVASIPQVVTAKYTSMERFLQDVEVTRQQIKFLPIDVAYYGAARSNPEFADAFWSSGASCGPLVAVALRDIVAKAKKTNDWTAAKQIAGEIAGALRPLMPNGSFREFSFYNIALEKARMDAAGWMKAGPVRPPNQFAPEEYLAGARKAGQLWNEIHKRYETAGKANAA